MVCLSHEMNAGQSLGPGKALPQSDEMRGVGQFVGIIHHKQGLAVHTDVTGIAESRQQGAEVCLVVGIAGIELLHQHAVRTFLAELLVLPTMVGPGQTEGEVGLAGRQHLLEGTLQQTTSVTEPIVPVTEALYSILPGHVGLLLPGLGKTQVIIPQIGGNTRLIVSAKQRTGLAHVGPFGKALAPPGIVLRRGMELGQIEGNDAGRATGYRIGFFHVLFTF